MSGRERRNSPGKVCAVPLRFRVNTNGRNAQADLAASYGMRDSKALAQAATLEGQALNISELGVYFTSREPLQVGEALDMFFTLPRELTGRLPEQVRCALTAVMRRMIERPGTFDAKGWLTIGFAGHQPAMGEPYISTGSLYLCAAAWLPLGLSASDEFWAGAAKPWTAVKIWGGENMMADHASSA